MTFERATMYAHYSLRCPDGISPMRWKAMLNQIIRVYGFGWLAPY